MVRVVAGLSRFLRGTAVVLTAGVCLALWAPSTFAGKGVVSVFGAAGSGDGQFANAAATAVNLSSGDVYVVDQFGFRVKRFDSSGSFLGAFGWGVADGSAVAQTCSSGCQAGLQGSGDGQFDTPQGVAIDQTDGSVYVVDGNNNRVEKFDASGNYLSQFGTAGSAESQFSGPQGIAVDPTDGSVYVVDSNNNRVEKFDNAGAFVSMFGFGVAGGNSAFETCSSSCQAGLGVGDEGGFNFPTRVAVDSTGRVYVLDLFNGRIERYTSAGAFDEVFDPTDVNPNTFAAEIAIGPGNDHVYVAQAAPDYSEQRVFEIDDTGTLIDQHAVGAQVFNASGLALNASSQNIYLADGFATRVLILGDITAPDLTIDPATNITATGASLSGSVTPNGDPPVGWHFEISTDDASWAPTGSDQDAGNGNTPVPVNQNLAGLVPNTHYFARLAATRPFNATVYSPEIQFDTPAIAPDVITDPPDDITPNHATLTGRINPHHSSTSFYFEYGTTTAYGTSVPVTQDADAGSDNFIVAELQPIYGLTPATSYHYRLVATNQVTTIHGEDQVFTTTTPPPPSTPRPGIPGTGFLPDNRGWEKVSPNDKNGADIMADSQRARVSTDGNATNFASLTAFGDAVGTGTATDYLSTRGANGWATHAIIPLQRPTTLRDLLETLQPRYVGPLSDDLSHGIFLGINELVPDPNTANVANLYLRDDLTAPGQGSYQLVSGCPLCASTGTPLPPLPLRMITGGAVPYLTGTSTDFEHVVFESQQLLTADAPGNCSDLTDVSACPGKLYEWDHGTVRLVGILPDSACGSPPCVPPQGSQAGQGAGAFQGLTELTPHIISRDGARIIFTVPAFAGSQSGDLYIRVAHATTMQVNASERTSPDPGGFQPATYWDASSDGMRVFFTTTTALTDDAPTNGAVKLYMYDASRPASDAHHLVLISVDDEPTDTGQVENVQGISDDGHYVYFGAAGQLVAGGPRLGTGRAIYVWHDGHIRYITAVDAPDFNEDRNTASWILYRPTARVTPDGRHFLFTSGVTGRGPTGYDQGQCNDNASGTGCRQFYLYSYASDGVACVSCMPNGGPATASAFTAVRAHTSGAGTTWAQTKPMSDDGQHVFFSTAEPLAQSDTNRTTDVYEYDTPTGTVKLITSGSDPLESYFMNSSASGRDVFFLTRQALVHSDTDDSYDMYDARVDGGFKEQSPPVSCSNDTCQGQEAGAPDLLAPGSSLVTHAGKAPGTKARRHSIRCKKRYVRKKVRGKTRCVKKHKPHRARKNKRARIQKGAK